MDQTGQSTLYVNTILPTIASCSRIPGICPSLCVLNTTKRSRAQHWAGVWRSLSLPTGQSNPIPLGRIRGKRTDESARPAQTQHSSLAERSRRSGAGLSAAKAARCGHARFCHKPERLGDQARQDDWQSAESLLPVCAPARGNGALSLSGMNRTGDAEAT